MPLAVSPFCSQSSRQARSSGQLLHRWIDGRNINTLFDNLARTFEMCASERATALPQKFADRNEAFASAKNPTEGEVGEVQRASRHDLVRALAPRYGHVSKHEKSQILDQVCEVTGYTRKYALTLLKDPPDERLVKQMPSATQLRAGGGRVAAAVLAGDRRHLLQTASAVPA